MRVGGPCLVVLAQMRAVQTTQALCQAAGHQSTSTEVAVEPPVPVEQDLRARQTSPHTFDIRV